jgi:predicted permease
MVRDLRYAVRTLLRAKAWTTVIVLSLALGIGANTALFSVINVLLLTPIPVDSPNTLVRFRYAGPNDMVTSSSGYGTSAKDAAGRDTRATFSYPMFQQLVADNRTLHDLVACAPNGRVNLVVDGHADIASSFISTGNYYNVLGVRVSRGRVLLPSDDQPAAPPAAVISHRYWTERFGSDPAAVGKVVTANNVPVTIVGVIAPEFTGVQQPVADPPDISFPLALDGSINPQTGNAPPRLQQPTYWWLEIIGRLNPGVTAGQVQANLSTVFEHTSRAGLDSYLASLSERDRARSSNTNRTRVPSLLVDSASRGVYDVSSSSVQTVTVLGIVVVLVLLIVCANVANLLLSRAAARRREISVRLSMGATRLRLVWQLLIESLLLAAIGGVLGVLIARWGVTLMPDVSGHAPIADWRVLAFLLAVSALTGVVFGIAPALRATAVDLSTTLKETSRSVVSARSPLGKALLVVQVALSLTLLVGAGLLVRTVQNLRQVDVGFNPRNLVLFRVNPQLNGYSDARKQTLYGELLERLAVLPGVRGAAASQTTLIAGSVNSTSIFIQGRSYVRGERNTDSINRLVVSPNFFQMMEMPLVTGRSLTARDSENAPKVVVINEAAARAHFPNQNPIGQHFGSSPEDAGRFEIVGLVHDAKYSEVREVPPPTMYVPYLQAIPSGMNFEVRTVNDTTTVVAEIRALVRGMDPDLPVTSVSTQIEQVELRFQRERLLASAFSLFGSLALLLAAIGLFGLMSYSVARRTNEIGIRMALGASREHVVRLVLSESLILVAIGAIIGIVGALVGGRYLTSLLFGVGAMDPLTMLVATATIAGVSILAGYLPARRASQVDPLVALHAE